MESKITNLDAQEETEIKKFRRGVGLEKEEEAKKIMDSILDVSGTDPWSILALNNVI